MGNTDPTPDGTSSIEGLLAEIVQRLVPSIKPRRVILFGSYAYGRPNRDSDIDLLVVAETDQPPRQRSREIRRLLRGIGHPLDILVYTPEEVDFFADLVGSVPRTALREGRILYESH